MNPPTSSLERPLGVDSQLFFMHIPRTGGRALIPVLERQFAPEEIARGLSPVDLLDKPESFFRRHRYFHGVIEQALMRHVLPRTPSTITMIRQPTARYLSQFDYERRIRMIDGPDPAEDVRVAFRGISLRRFVLDPPENLRARAQYYHNRQAKMVAFELSGNPDEPCEVRTPTAEQAQRHLQQLSFFGLTERYQESLLLLAYTFGWPPVMMCELTSKWWPEQRRYPRNLTTDVLEQIYNLNRVDLEMYSRAQELFELRLLQMGHELLERHGRREHAHLRLPLPNGVLVNLLETHLQPPR